MEKGELLPTPSQEEGELLPS